MSELPNAAKNKIPDPMTNAAFFTESHSPPGPSWAEKEQQLCITLPVNDPCWYCAVSWCWATAAFPTKTSCGVEMSQKQYWGCYWNQLVCLSKRMTALWLLGSIHLWVKRWSTQTKNNWIGYVFIRVRHLAPTDCIAITDRHHNG